MAKVFLRILNFKSLTLILLLFFSGYFLQVQANSCRQIHKITLSATNILLGDVFKTIRKQTGLTVTYSIRETKINEKKRVTVNFIETDINDAMTFLLSDKKDLAFAFGDEAIIIFKDDNSKKKPFQGKNISDTVPSTFPLTGKVTDVSGNSLPGATVMVRGTKHGTTTDTDGKFLLPNVNKGEIVVVSSVGFSTMEIPVKSKSIFAQLNTYVNSLDETVVIAYGTTTKRMSTGNISTIKAADIEKQPVNNPLLAMQGRIPGIFITQATGLPGTGVNVLIQGKNSIGNGNDPLYVIDGVPYTSQLLPSINSSLGNIAISSNGGSPFNFINPSDIASIDILKDADATAIYGSRAANGAILITTKKGVAGKTQVDINMQSGLGKVTRKLDLLNTQQYLQIRHEALQNDSISMTPTDYDINGVWDTTRYTDWQKKLIGGTAQYTNIQATVSGGNTNTQYLIGAGYHKETTVFPGDFSDQKNSLHFNINSSSPDKKFRIQLSGNYLIDNTLRPNTDLTLAAMTLPPDAPALYNKDGSLNWGPLQPDGNSSFFINPLSNLYNKFKSKTNNLISNALLSYQILPGLDIKSSFGYTNQQINETNTTSSLSVPPERRAPFNPRSAYYGNNNINTWIIEPQATYRHSISKGKLDVLAGASIQQSNSSQLQLLGTGYNSDAVLEDLKSATAVMVQSTILSTYKYNAAFGRINYAWEDKYIINFTGRRDGSSRFGAKNQFHNFGSIGVGWIFSTEKFIQKTLPFLSFGKIRGSFGTTGNDQIGEYQFLNLYNPVDGVSVPYQGASGLQPVNIANPYLAWEETKKLQLGLDAGFLNDKISVTLNYNRNRSSNQLLSYQLPIFAGFGSIERNFPATVQNSGWEFSLSSKNINTRNFNWSNSVNLTIPQNKLIDFPNIANSAYAQKLIIGEPITITKAYHLLGVDPVTGIYQFADSKGNPTPQPDYTDQPVSIKTAPAFYGGFQNSFRYKGLELDILFQFVKQIGQNYLFGSIPGNIYNNQPTNILDRWQKPGDKTSIQKPNSDYRLFVPWVNASLSDAAWSDASYIRLKNLSLSWQLPEVWKTKIHLQNCRIYIQGQNLLTITRYIGLDPETQNQFILPPLRVLTMGIQASL